MILIIQTCFLIGMAAIALCLCFWICHWLLGFNIVKKMRFLNRYFTGGKRLWLFCGHCKREVLVHRKSITSWYDSLTSWGEANFRCPRCHKKRRTTFNSHEVERLQKFHVWPRPVKADNIDKLLVIPAWRKRSAQRRIREAHNILAGKPLF